MIKSFKNELTEQLYNGKRPLKWRSFAAQAERRLTILDNATSLDDLRNLPSNRLEALVGDRKGQFSIRINKQRRICFEWFDNESYNVEIVDYH